MLKQFTVKTNIESKNIHVIGHSLGAHVSTAVGKIFKGKIGRITGLDPALPFFSEQDFDVISKFDAQFVDIIHTCANILGDFNPKGMVDFYPNFGTPPQPGCEFQDFMAACKLIKIKYKNKKHIIVLFFLSEPITI